MSEMQYKHEISDDQADTAAQDAADTGMWREFMQDVPHDAKRIRTIEPRTEHDFFSSWEATGEKQRRANRLHQITSVRDRLLPSGVMGEDYSAEREELVDSILRGEYAAELEEIKNASE